MSAALRPVRVLDSPDNIAIDGVLHALTGAGAVVELPSGQVRIVPAYLVEFTDGGAIDTTPLRDHFAGQALAGVAANPASGCNSPSDLAHWAYQCADAMLRERAK